jgi:hypothetical protein
MSDAQIKVLNQDSGSNVDVSPVTRADGTQVNRQRAVISDPEIPDGHARVFGEDGKGRISTQDEALLAAVLQIARDVREIKEVFQRIKF